MNPFMQYKYTHVSPTRHPYELVGRDVGRPTKMETWAPTLCDNPCTSSAVSQVHEQSNITTIIIVTITIRVFIMIATNFRVFIITRVRFTVVIRPVYST